MTRYEARKPRGKKTIYILIILILLTGTGFAGFYFGPSLYFQFTGDAVLRLKKRAELYETLLAEKKEKTALYAFIQDTRKLLDIIEKDEPSLAQIQYYRGLFDLYEFLLRHPLYSHELINMTGRGFLPEQEFSEEIPQEDSIVLAFKISSHFRKALAFDPSLKEAPVANFGISLADLFYTGRTDLNLLDHIDRTGNGDVGKGLEKTYDWLRVALFTLLGRKDDAVPLINALKEKKTGLTLSEDEANLLLSHVFFSAKDYLKALERVRAIKPDAKEEYKIEATRMEGEIFFVQNGVFAGLPFFIKAYEMTGRSDPFIKERLDFIQSKTKPVK